MRHGRSRGPADVLEDPRDRREDAVGGEVADSCVDRRQPIDVEHEERNVLAPTARSPDLAVEQRVERGPVVEIREWIALRNGVRLAKLE